MIILKEKSGIFNIIFTSFFVVLALLFTLVFPIFTAYAQTGAEEDIKSQIATLKEQIQQLQIQITAVQSEELASAPIATPTPAPTATEYKFIRNLKKGDRGEDVRQLQIILNSDPETAVATEGVGSAGNETTYFGFLTKSAVIKFQEKYASEILTPLSLSVGTGHVGSSTKAKLNEISTAPPAVPLPTTPLTSKTPISPTFIQSDKLTVMYPSQYSGPAGTKLALFGFGFKENENHIIHFGNEYTIQDATVLNSGALEFVVPSDILFGKYSVWVTNEKEKSNDDAFFIVTDPLVLEPTVSGLSPQNVKYGDEITINGSGFTVFDNAIRTSYGIIRGVSSLDGESLVFKVKPSIFENVSGNDTQIEFWVYIENKNGISNSARFMLSI